MATKKKTSKKEFVPGGVSLAAPWTYFGNLVKNIFANDAEVTVTTDECEESCVYNIYIASNNEEKLIAIKKLIGKSRVYGNITVKINYEEPDSIECTADDIETALKDTGYLVKVEHIKTVIGNFDCPIFAKDIIQFFNDDTTDLYGNANIIVRDAIRQIVDENAIPANMILSTANGTE